MIRFTNIKPAEVLYGFEWDEEVKEHVSFPERWGIACAEAVLPAEVTTRTGFMQLDPHIESLCHGLENDRTTIKVLVSHQHPDYHLLFEENAELPVGKGGAVLYIENWEYIGSLQTSEFLDVVFPKAWTDSQVEVLLRQQLGEDHWIFQ